MDRQGHCLVIVRENPGENLGEDPGETINNQPMLIKITRGLDIPLAGTPEPVPEAGNEIRSVAVLGGDYIGLRPRMRVQAGDRVSLGQPLFADKHDPAVLFTAPGSGVVTAVNRGARRALQSVVISLDESAAEESTHADLVGTDPDVVSIDTT